MPSTPTDTSVASHASADGPAGHVAVEATRLVREVRGIGRYVRALLPRFLAQRPALRLTLYAKPGDVGALAALYAGVAPGRVDVRPIGELRRSRADVVWYPWNIAGPAAPRRATVVVTIHDVTPIALPDPRLLMWRRNWRWRRRFRATVRRAALLVVDSHFTASEVHRLLGVPHDRMRVVLLAADDVAPPPATDDAVLLGDLGVRTPFVLAVGAAEARKNLALLERAMPRVAAALPEATLVLAGPRPASEPAAANGATNGAGGGGVRRQTLGFVSDDALAALYRGAGCLVVPSTYEGFGLPVLEALQLGTPTICARAASLPEVGGDAVVWVDPTDDAALAARIVDVLTDDALRARLRAAGFARAAQFSWDDTARRTLAVFDEAVGIVGGRAGPRFR